LQGIHRSGPRGAAASASVGNRERSPIHARSSTSAATLFRTDDESPASAGLSERMMGLEPTTFCMAKVGGRSRPFACVRRNLSFAAASFGATERQRTRTNAECSHCSHRGRCHLQLAGPGRPHTPCGGGRASDGTRTPCTSIGPAFSEPVWALPATVQSARRFKAAGSVDTFPGPVSPTALSRSGSSDRDPPPAHGRCSRGPGAAAARGAKG
jgi:hypothetical protein